VVSSDSATLWANVAPAAVGHMFIHCRMGAIVYGSDMDFYCYYWGHQEGLACEQTNSSGSRLVDYERLKAR
jgi:hypothetical protein